MQKKEDPLVTISSQIKLRDHMKDINEKMISCVKVNKNLLIVGLESGSIMIFDMDKNKMLTTGARNILLHGIYNVAPND